MGKKKEALKMFGERLNCAQSVFASFAGDLGLDKETALRIASGFGSGMGRMALTCGAVTGALMVIGLKYGYTSGEDKQAKNKVYDLAAEFMREFSRQNGSITCRELLDCDISTPEGILVAREKDLFRTLCPKYVRSSVVILEEMLETEKNGA